MWKKFLAWSGWRKIFVPHPLITLLLSTISAAGLFWVFLGGREQTLTAYLLYPVSAYALTTLIVLICREGPKLRHNPLLRWVKGFGGDGAFDLPFYFEQVINFCYGGFKVVSGLMLQSVWIATDGIYNFTQGVIQLYQILRHRKRTDLIDRWKTYRFCGALMILVNLTMTGLVFQMIHLGAHEENTEISMIATAAFTFYKLIRTFVDLAKDRKHKSPVDSAVRFLDFGQALYNLFVLQVGLLWTFGEDTFQSYYLLNSLTGFAVCVLVCGIGVYMLWRANRDMKMLKSMENN